MHKTHRNTRCRVLWRFADKTHLWGYMAELQMELLYLLARAHFLFPLWIFFSFLKEALQRLILPMLDVCQWGIQIGRKFSIYFKFFI